MACPESLIEVGTEHRLADRESLEMMLEAVETVAKLNTKVEKSKVGVGWRRLLSILLPIMVVEAVFFAVLEQIPTAVTVGSFLYHHWLRTKTTLQRAATF